MKISIDKSKASRLINAGGLILITVSCKESFTITPCAWHMPVSKNPCLVAVALSKKHFSSELISKAREFVINIPEAESLEKIMLCAKSSGRDMDKFSLSGFSSEASKEVTSPKIGECVANIECRLKEKSPCGDHLVFIGEVVHCEAEERLFRGDLWDTERVDLLFHLGGRRFFNSGSGYDFSP